MSAKYFSTSATLLVSPPKSIRAAPNEKNPSGILYKPEPIPAKTDSIVLISFSSSGEMVVAFDLPASISSKVAIILLNCKIYRL